jgi:hypothetical protein
MLESDRVSNFGGVHFEARWRLMGARRCLSLSSHTTATTTTMDRGSTSPWTSASPTSTRGEYFQRTSLRPAQCTHTCMNFQVALCTPAGPQRDRSALHDGPPTFKSLCACMHAATVSTAVTIETLPNDVAVRKPTEAQQRAHAHARQAPRAQHRSIAMHALMGNPCMWTVNVRVDPHAYLRARTALHARAHACMCCSTHACMFLFRAALIEIEQQ